MGIESDGPVSGKQITSADHLSVLASVSVLASLVRMLKANEMQLEIYWFSRW